MVGLLLMLMLGRFKGISGARFSSGKLPFDLRLKFYYEVLTFLIMNFQFSLSILISYLAIRLFGCSFLRGGGGGGKTWHHDGRRTKKENSIKDFISCAKFLIQEEIVQENKLAGWGYSAGGLLVASAINYQPDLFRTAVLKVCINFTS